MKTINFLLLGSLLASQSNAELLEEIIVNTPTNSQQLLNDTVSQTEIITSEEIEERGYTTVMQALASLSSFSYTQNGGIGAASSVMLRGMNSKQTLVMIDGIRYNDITGLNGANFEHLLVDNINSIEVVKGAQSGIWGADASAGVINIITKKTKSGAHGNIGVELGSFEGRKYNGSISYKSDKFYVSLAHVWLKSSGYSVMSSKDESLDDLEDDGYKNKTTNLRAGVKLTEHSKINFEYVDIDAQSEGDGYDLVTYAPDPNSIYDSTVRNKLTSVTYDYSKDKNEFAIYSKKTTFLREYPQSSYDKLFEGKTDEYGVRYKRSYRENDFFILGIERTEFLQDDAIDAKYSNNAIYATNSNKFIDGYKGETILTQSLRYDKFNAFEDKMTGKFGVKYLPKSIESLYLAFNIGWAYNVPTLYQLHSPYYGTKILNPEETRTMDISAGYKGATLSYFVNRIDNMIDFDMQTYKYNNISGKSKIDGVEFSYKTALLENFYLSGGYTHLLNAKNNKGQNLGRRVKNKVNLTLDYYGVDKLHIGVLAQYTGQRHDQADKQGKQTGRYSTFDLTADYEFNENIKVYAKVENLTDKKYQTIDGYSSSPRAFFAGVRAKF